MPVSHHIYDRVYLLGVDGAGNFFTQADTPNLSPFSLTARIVFFIIPYF